jgi:Right handed beta helix region
MNTSRPFTLPSRAMFAAAIVTFVGFGQNVSAQGIDQLVSKGGDVHLRTAYQLSHTLVIPSNTHITCDAGASLFDDPSNKVDSVLLIKGSGISIEGCNIYANSAPVLIYFAAHSSGISFVRNHLHSFNHAHGVVIDAPDIHRIKINNNTFDEVGYGILQNVHAADLTDVTIDGNSFSNVWADGVELNDPVTVKCCGIQLTDVRASGVTIRHNKFRIPKHAGSTTDAGFCVGVAGAHDIEISDNDCVAWSAGVHVEDRAYNIKILRNSITTDDHGGVGEQSAIWIIDGNHMTISQNKIKDAAGDAIHLDYDSTHQTSDIEIVRNEVKGCGRYGLFITGGSIGPMNSNVHDNTVSGCAKPVFLSGKLKSLSIHSNRLEAKNGCVFNIAKDTNSADVDIKDNKDANSGEDANATCGG